ncbi:MAG: J domain-containing protein, partial [Mycoplasmoidaceae bacterium]|nr:J domain-containing protein [Mycoplasmoidaceae bacterium]
MSDTQKIKSAFEDGALQDFYQLLGVDFDATNEEIKKGYHTELKIHHPDCPNGDALTMRRIMLAYKTLSDPVIRSVYNIFYKELINRRNGTQDVSVESTRDHEPVMQEFSNESSKSKEAFTQDVSKKSTKSKESVQSESLNKPSSMNRTSCYTKSYMNSIKKRGTSYHFKISPNAIRNILRNHHYSEKTIDNFLLWCQEHHMKIISGKELHSVFLKYLSMTKEMKETETVHPK